MKRGKLLKWNVSIGAVTAREIVARSAGQAVRNAVRFLIRYGHIKRQPQTDSDGWFKNTTAEICK